MAGDTMRPSFEADIQKYIASTDGDDDPMDFNFDESKSQQMSVKTAMRQDFRFRASFHMRVSGASVAYSHPEAVISLSCYM